MFHPYDGLEFIGPTVAVYNAPGEIILELVTVNGIRKADRGLQHYRKRNDRARDDPVRGPQQYAEHLLLVTTEAGGLRHHANY